MSYLVDARNHSSLQPLIKIKKSLEEMEARHKGLYALTAVVDSEGVLQDLLEYVDNKGYRATYYKRNKDTYIIITKQKRPSSKKEDTEATVSLKDKENHDYALEIVADSSFKDLFALMEEQKKTGDLKKHHGIHVLISRQLRSIFEPMEFIKEEDLNKLNLAVAEAHEEEASEEETAAEEALEEEVTEVTMEEVEMKEVEMKEVEMQEVEMQEVETEIEEVIGWESESEAEEKVEEEIEKEEEEEEEEDEDEGKAEENYETEEQVSFEEAVSPLYSSANKTSSRSKSVPREGLIYLLTTPVLGQGDQDLGRMLMRHFIFTIKETIPLPSRIIFMNQAVYLTAQNSEVLEHLQEMEGMGVELLSSRTCVNYYRLQEELAVGKVAGMTEILEGLRMSARCITI